MEFYKSTDWKKSEKIHVSLRYTYEGTTHTLNYTSSKVASSLRYSHLINCGSLSKNDLCPKFHMIAHFVQSLS